MSPPPLQIFQEKSVRPHSDPAPQPSLPLQLPRRGQKGRNSEFNPEKELGEGPTRGARTREPRRDPPPHAHTFFLCLPCFFFRKEKGKGDGGDAGLGVRAPPPGSVRVPAQPAGGALRQGGGRAARAGIWGARADLGLNGSALVIICNHRA